jgi:CarD family transcriptional regulator
MDFNVGENVVHPQHGLGSVKEIRETSVLGETVTVYVIATKKMELQIPVNRARELGIRRVATADQAETMLKILRSPAKEEPFTSSEGWYQRYEELKQRIREGQAEDLAEIVRDLDKNSKVYELNIKEREILTQAKDLLIQELTSALAISKTKVTERVDDALRANLKKRAPR